METDVVSPSRIERLLELASAYNVPLLVTTESRGNTYRYKSRMLEMRVLPGRNTLIIDHPITDGPAIALTRDTPVTVFFALDRNRLVFDSRVIGKSTFTLAIHRETTALEITYPNVLKSGERRSYYRVPVPKGKPISTECGMIADVSDWVVQEPGAWNFPSSAQFEGRIVDISVGGILLAIRKTGKNIPKVGTKLGLRFSVAAGETPIVLKGIVRRILEGPSTEENTIGVEFIDTAEEFEYKLAINRLYRYVAERQRQIGKSGTK
ncbi:MAG: PilZ domain-containing protein [Candidatus Hydrogenedentota bacterium]|nr:MAG: PilZ domain-containing protein [Candidatus Hydrogenedentota bacterium]